MITVVIPAYNEEKSIGKCLQSLVSQQTNKQFDVIVVDNNSTDKTQLEVKKFQSQLNLKIIQEKQKGRGAARKTGFALVKDGLIFSTDADTVVPATWIETLRDKLVHNNCVAVTGSCCINDCSVSQNRIFNAGQPWSMKIYWLLYHHYWLSGFSFAIRAEAYQQSGGFNERLNGLEDIDLSFRVSQIGDIAFIPELPVLVSGRRFKKGLWSGTASYLIAFYKYYYKGNKDFLFADPRS